MLLFAYGKQDAFPVDVWVRRALQELYFPRRRPSAKRLEHFANTHFGPNAGYAQHLTANPYPGFEAKKVLMVQAFGDHQVANVSTEMLARTVGATIHEPSLAPGRSLDVEPHWGIKALDHANPTNGVVVLWDFGTPPPPTVNLPPTEPEYGDDPHGAGSREPLVLTQALTFLLTGQVNDVCNGGPCQSNVLKG